MLGGLARVMLERCTDIMALKLGSLIAIARVMLRRVADVMALKLGSLIAIARTILGECAAGVTVLLRGRVAFAYDKVSMDRFVPNIKLGRWYLFPFV